MPTDKRNSAARGYGHAWRVARAAFLADHPLCVMCMQAGRVVAASVVDHIQPHRGDMALFWDRSNWQPLCAHHHSAAKQREERTGIAQGCDASGTPLQPGAHWAR